MKNKFFTPLDCIEGLWSIPCVMHSKQASRQLKSAAFCLMFAQWISSLLFYAAPATAHSTFVRVRCETYDLSRLHALTLTAAAQPLQLKPQSAEGCCFAVVGQALIRSTLEASNVKDLGALSFEGHQCLFVHGDCAGSPLPVQTVQS